MLSINALKRNLANFIQHCKNFRHNPKEVSLILWNEFKKSSFFWGTPQNDIGVSIGHRNVIAVELDKTSSPPRLTRCAVREIAEDNSYVSDILKDIFEKENFSNAFVNTSLSGKSVIVRFLKFPKMNKKELRSSLEYESEKYIPFTSNEVYIDFHILESDESKKFVDVALVAARKETVNELLTTCKQARLTVKAIDIDSFACLNTFLAGYAAEKMKNTALINIGAKVSNLLIISHGLPAFTRDIYFGGDDIITSISNKLNIDIREASKLKYSLKAPTNREVRSVVNESLGYLMTEIKLSFDYFEHQLQKEKEKIDTIYLIGGTSRLEGLIELFEETVHIHTVLLDPLQCVTVNEEVNQALITQYAASLAVPIGLALR